MSSLLNGGQVHEKRAHSILLAIFDHSERLLVLLVESLIEIVVMLIIKLTLEIPRLEIEL